MKSNYFRDVFEGFKKILGFCFEKLLILLFGSSPKKIDPNDKSLTSLPTFGKGSFTCTFEWLSYILFTDRQSTSVLLHELINGIGFATKDIGIIYCSLFTKPQVILTKVSTVKPVLRSKENVQKSMIYIFIKPWLRTGLLVSDKSIWRVRRKCLVPTMHPKIIESYLPIFLEHAQIFSSKLGDRLGQQVDIIHLLRYMTLDIILETAMGVKMEIQKTEDSEYLDSIHTLTLCSIERLLKIWYWPYWLFKLFPLGRKYVKALNCARNFTKNVIAERKTQLLASKLQVSESNSHEVIKDTKKRLSFLDLILELHLKDQTFGLDDVQDEVETLLLGGHDTSSLTMGWTFYLLGLHPEALAEVQKELDAVLGTDPDVPVTFEDVKNLIYLESAIKEAARLYSPGAATSRVLDENVEIS